MNIFQDELIEDNIFDYVYPEDQIILKRQISQDIKTGKLYITCKSMSEYQCFYIFLNMHNSCLEITLEISF